MDALLPGLRLLLADDNALIRMTFTVAARRFDAEVVATEDGEQAWSALEQSEAAGQGFDVLITDLKMPRLGGLALVERLRQDARYAALPVVVLTANQDAESLAPFQALGVRHSLGKPFTPAQVQQVLTSVLADQG